MIYDLWLQPRQPLPEAEPMTSEELKRRTMRFAVRVLALVDRVPKTTAGRTVGGQFARSACSVPANYRAALRGKSRADFINRITIVLEEADESEFWLTMLVETQMLDDAEVHDLIRESGELIRIFGATRRTARNHPS